jgi:hypothetical protein
MGGDIDRDIYSSNTSYYILQPVYPLSIAIGSTPGKWMLGEEEMKQKQLT